MTRKFYFLYTLLIFSFHKIVVWFTSWSTYTLFDPKHAYRHFIFIDGFVKWDSDWYLRIAEYDYQTLQATAFFPLYPYTIRLFSQLAKLPYDVSGLLIANLCLFASLYLLLRLVDEDFGWRPALRTVFLLITFPTAFFLSCLYTEPMFLLLTVGSFYAMRKRKFWIAGILGFFASGTRNTGILLMIPFAIEYLSSKNWKLSQVRFDVAAVGLIPGGLLGYMMYLWNRFGDPLAFSHVQHYWNRVFHMPWATLYYGTLDSWFGPKTLWGKILHRLEMILMYFAWIVFIAGQWRKQLPLSYLAYALCCILTPLTAPNIYGAWFMSFPRFELAIFPIFILASLWIRPRILFAGISLCMLVLGMYLQYKWHRHYFIA